MVFHYFHGVFQFPARFRLSLYDEVENGHKLSLGLKNEEITKKKQKPAQVKISEVCFYTFT